MYTAHSNYPGIEFLGAPRRKQVTSKGADIVFSDIGLSISVPEQPLQGIEDSVDLLIHPCLSGPFIVPDGYELASPVYMIETSKQGVLQKPCTVRIKHFLKLSNQQDCHDMVFLSSNSKPPKVGPYQYVFKSIEHATPKFSPDNKVGEIELKHFCGLTTAKRYQHLGEAGVK